MSVKTKAGKISNITFRGIGEENQNSVTIEKGETLFQNCTFTSSKTGVLVENEGAAPIFENCSFQKSDYGIYVSGAAPIFNRCQISSNISNILVEKNAVCIIHSCEISGGKIGLDVTTQSHATILNSTIRSNENHNILASNSYLQLRNSQLMDSKTGLYIHQVFESAIENTSFTNHSLTGMTFEKRNDVFISNCQISGAACGIAFQKQATGKLQDCEIHSSTLIGIAILEESAPIILHCKVENGENVGLFLSQGKGIVSKSKFCNHSYLDVFSEGENTTTIEFCLFDKTNMTIDNTNLREWQSDYHQREYSSNSEEQATIQSYLKELHSYIGLDGIKNQVDDLIDYISYTNERRNVGLSSGASIRHHSIFLGKPGTGKTTIARLLSKIFYQLGLIKKETCVEVDRKDLVGEVIGQTAIKTKKVLEKAVDGVLFIDEAYTLVKPESPNDFGKEALEIILKKMEDDPSFIVIAAGYPEEMRSFLEANPGLKDRFKHHFHFEDFDPKQLLQIFESMLHAEEYRLSSYAKDLILQEFTYLYRKRDRSFGNARMVRKYFEEVKMKHAKRCTQLRPLEKTKQALTTILSEDIEQILRKNKFLQCNPVPVNEDKLKALLLELNSYIGLTAVKREINNMVKLVKFYQEENRNYTSNFAPHTVFLGNPGTGKTTVARLLSQIYEALGILPVGDLVEVGREDLVGGYVGQTEIKTKEVLQKSIGSTLFIDEAYSLTKKNTQNDFGSVAIDIILKTMEDQRGSFSLIVAGYTEEMKEFLKFNPGLSDRFGQIIMFEDYSPIEMLQITKKIVSDSDFQIEEEALNCLSIHFEECYEKRDCYFSNARFVRNIVEAAIRKATLRISEMPKGNRNGQNIIRKTDLSLTN